MQQNQLILVGIFAGLITGYLIFGLPRRSQTVDVETSALKDIYNQWKATYNLKVGSAEDDQRFKIFAENYEIINNQNRILGSKYKLGLNQFAHLTLSEFSALHLGYNPKAKALLTKGYGTQCNKTVVNAVPNDIDWDAQGKVSQVKDQGTCGSCWAFSATGAVESILAIVTGKVTEFSEQQLIDCSTSYGNEGCNGGLMTSAFKYITDHGIVVEDSYPYKGVDGTCTIPSGVPTATISGYIQVKANSSSSLESAVAKNPVSVAVEADSSAFQLYKSGVLTGDACGINLNHGVLAVGYGTLNGTAFWKVKNSWGSSWGNNGYILIERIDGPGTCGINIDASYPTNYC